MLTNIAPKTCIILVNYNGYSDTIECLESLLQLEDTDFQVIVVDNASPNNSLHYIHAWADNYTSDSISPDHLYTHCSKAEAERAAGDLLNYKILTVQAGENLGFAGGNNVGLRYALKQNMHYFWLLNNDTVVKPNTLSILIKTINETSLGILGSKLCFYHKPDTIQALGGKYNRYMAVSTHIAEGQQASAFTSGIVYDLDYVVGASMFVTRAFLQDVGLLAEHYFLYFEELDWAKEAEKKGWRIGTSLDAVVLHKEGASAGSGHWSTRSLLSDLLIFRNRFIFSSRFYSRHLPFVYFTSFLIILNRFRRGQHKAGRKMLKYVLSLNIFGLKESIAANQKIL